MLSKNYWDVADNDSDNIALISSAAYMFPRQATV
jgi:hypothetical protein